MPNEPSIGPPWTILKLLRWTTSYFHDHVPDSPRMDAEILLAHALGCQRLDLYLRHDQPLTAGELSRFKQMIKRRVNHEPVAYILEQREFWSLRIGVTPDVLIPRPDTESLVEVTLGVLTQEHAPDLPPRILELGVGSGAVSIVLAKERPRAQIIASDISPAAAAVAARNARCHEVNHRIHFFIGWWMDCLKTCSARFDVIVANPPYIPTGDLSDLAPDVIDYEPPRALDGGKDGLDSIRHLVIAAPKHLKPGGYLILEMGYDQKERVQNLGLASDCYNDISFHKDDAGHQRVARMRTHLSHLSC